MTSLTRPRVEFISTILQTVLNLGLLSLGLILVVFLGKETVHLADVLFAPEQTSKYALVERLVVYFLYFEFIALIVKYFQSGFHFPLRYFVYIGITAIVRLIIVDHKSPARRADLLGGDPAAGDHPLAVQLKAAKTRIKKGRSEERLTTVTSWFNTIRLKLRVAVA